MNREDIKYCLLLSFSSVIAYFQLSFFLFSTKWDNLSAFFAYKYTASEWWLSGHLPLWDPYQNLGYPMHANPQSYVWYPITWILNLPKGYSLYALNIETVLHVALASIGMYFLAKWVKIKPSIAFLAGLTYGLSGFIIASNHMIGFTIGAAWLPWCIFMLLRVLTNPKITNIIGLSFVCYLQTTGAYIAFTIVLFYIFLAFILYHLIKNWNDKTRVKKAAYGVVLSCCLTLILSSPYLYSIYDSLEYFSRAKALNYQIANYSGNFSWQCFQSLYAPFINSSISGFNGVDVSLSNIYIGIVPLLLFALFIGFTKIKHKLTILIALILALLLALGVHTPVHMLTCKVLPGFNLFRHPYLFTLYFTLLAVLVAFKYLDSVTELSFKFLRTGIGLGVIILGVVWLFSFWVTDKNQINSIYSELIVLPEKTSFTTSFHIFIQLSISILLLIILYVSGKDYSTFKKMLPILIFLDLFFAIQLNGPTNMYYNIPFNQVQENLKKLTNSNLTNQSYDTPLISLNSERIKAQAGFWVNLNTYQRTTGTDGYNPFILSSFEKLKNSATFDSLIEEGIFTIRESKEHLSNFNIGHNFFQINTENSKKTELFLNQNYHHNWCVFIDNKQHKIKQNKTTGLMSVEVPPGTHLIKFQYRSKITTVLAMCSALFVLILLVVVSLITKKEKSKT